MDNLQNLLTGRKQQMGCCLQHTVSHLGLVQCYIAGTLAVGFVLNLAPSSPAKSILAEL